MALVDDWIAWYNFENNNIDSTPNRYDATGGTGATIYTTDPSLGKPGFCVNQLFTASRFFSAPDRDAFTFSSGGGVDLPFTLSAWIKPAAVDTTRTIVGKRAATTGEYQFRINTGKLEFVLFSNVVGTNIVVTTLANTLIIDNWYHVAVTYNGQGITTGAASLKLYINGLEATVTSTTSGTYAGMVNSSNGFQIGHYGGTSQFYNGMIDTIGVRSVVSTPQEINDLWNGGNGIDLFPPSNIKSNWIVWYSADNKGGVLQDDTGLNHTLIPTGTVNNFSKGGKPNGYYIFNTGGVNTYNTPDTGDLSFTTASDDLGFTFQTWIYPTDITGTKTIFSKYDDATNLREYLFEIVDGKVSIRLHSENSVSVYLGVLSTNSVLINTWSHVIVTYDKSKTEAGLKIYINGVLETNISNSAGTYVRMVSTTRMLTIGYTEGLSRNFVGNMDNISMRNISLLPLEVTYLYYTGKGRNVFPPLKEGWLAWYSADDASNRFRNDVTPGTYTIDPDGISTADLRVVTSGGKPNATYFIPSNVTTTNFKTVVLGAGTLPSEFNFSTGNTVTDIDYPFSVGFWFRHDVTPTGTQVFMYINKRTSHNFTYAQWQVSYNNSLLGVSISIFGNNSTSIGLRGTIPLVPVVGTWYRIMFTYDGAKIASGIKGYLDGIEQTLTYVTTGTYLGMPVSEAPLIIGYARDTGGESVNVAFGSFDNLGIRHGVVTAEEEQILYNAGKGYNPFILNSGAILQFAMG